MKKSEAVFSIQANAPACGAAERAPLASSWEGLDELQLALSRLEEIEFICSSPGSDYDSWVFTQLARASTELSAMLTDARSNIGTLKVG